MNPDSMTQVLRLEATMRKNRVRECDVCVGLVWCLHLPSLTRESPLPVSETTLTCKKNRSHHFDVCDHEEHCHHEDGCHPEEEELADGSVSYHRQPCLWVDTLRAFIVPSEWLIWSLSNLLPGMKSWVSVASFLI